ncbi:hypothetical protein AOQ84DRAFT_65207 [Glonium stellatum]|uniref:Uncharacterized protein n=1 Tax=Glonium stellatum TaxID=574774 RepID=A0A8E2EY90_9PEZI|nr:hypothetical protein AOQ84DRAFT_65207 [Glonium stellatum]
MYITSELFLGAEYPHSKRLPSFMSCDAMAECPPAISSHSHGNLGKRKRQSDSDSSANISSAHSNSFRNRALIPSPVPNSNYDLFNIHTARLPSLPLDRYMYDDMRFDISSSALDSTTLPLPVVDDLPPSKHRRRLHPCKLSRLSALTPSNNNATQPSTTHSTQTHNFSGGTKHPTPDLRPCHVCHKSPTRQRDLEGYKDCQQCEERACQICTRSCLGGCGRQLCSSCCKEVGEEGDAWCLDCLGRRGEHLGHRVS